MSVTLKDLAEHVGRSITTVSRALGGYSDVSPATRQLVQKAVKELGYEPNVTARQLQKRRTDTIALLLPPNFPRFSDPFFSQLLAGIVEQAAEYGIDLLVTTNASQDDEQACYLRYIRSRRVDGFIIVRTQREDARISLLQQHDFPFVAFGRTEIADDFPFIDDDGELGIRLMVQHLVDLGHKRIACIMEPANLMKAHLRLQGFLQALEVNNLLVDRPRIVEGGFRQRSGRLLAGELLELPKPPTAIVTQNDLLALGAMSAAHERGLTIGNDISITGFDDIDLAEYANPPLTTVHQPALAIGQQICQLLFDVINQQNIAEEQKILEPSLVIRQSAGPPSGQHL
ncbi:MAG: LacI family DNA-binding transcriptional regulator [Chloroflexota bacterium]